MSLDETISIMDKLVEKNQRPKKVSILGEDNELKFFGEFEQDNNSENGYYNKNYQVIGIAEKQNKKQMANTLLHELLHAVFHQMNFVSVIKNIEDEDELEEIMSHQLSSCLQSVITQNPRVFYWYCELLFPEIFKGIPERIENE